MRFQHTYYLIALALIPLLVLVFLALLQWKRATIKKIGNPGIVQELLRGHSPTAFIIKFGITVLALSTIIFGLANLQKAGEMDKIGRKGVDVMIALDVSKSMLAEDIQPNRLERAKQVINKLIDRMPDDRIGLIFFAGRAYMQMPLTIDHSMARMYVQQAGPEIVPTQGTMLSEALRMSNAAFNSKERKYKAVVLITDGEDHDPQSLVIAEQLSANGVMINTIGIGSAKGAPIIDRTTNEYKKDLQGNTVISKLSDQILKQLASRTSGIYVPMNDPNATVDAVMKQLATIEATALQDNAFKDYKSYFQWFLGAALFLLLVDFLLPERKWKTI